MFMTSSFLQIFKLMTTTFNLRIEKWQALDLLTNQIFTSQIKLTYPTSWLNFTIIMFELLMSGGNIYFLAL
jgi:hypothetical protein